MYTMAVAMDFGGKTDSELRQLLQDLDEQTRVDGDDTEVCDAIMGAVEHELAVRADDANGQAIGRWAWLTNAELVEQLRNAEEECDETIGDDDRIMQLWAKIDSIHRALDIRGLDARGCAVDLSPSRAVTD